MASILNDIKIDFSEYYGEKKIFCFVNFNENEIIKDIIDKFIGEKKLSKNPPILFVNERKIDENLSFKDNNIEKGDTIFVFKEKKGNKEIIIINENNKNKPFPNDIFSETQRVNSNISLRNYKGNELKIEENIYKYNFKNKKKRNIKNKKNNISIKNIKCLNPIWKLKNWKLNILILLFISIIIFIILYFLLNNINIKEKFIEEKLISNLDYKENQIYNLLNKKEYSLVFELKDMAHIP
jgi:hypothetical protein